MTRRMGGPAPARALVNFVNAPGQVCGPAPARALVNFVNSAPKVCGPARARVGGDLLMEVVRARGAGAPARP